MFIGMGSVGYAGEKQVKRLLPAIHRSELHAVYAALELLLPETFVKPQYLLPVGKAEEEVI
ncbi:predicted acetyltransferase [Paenibacillus popilliae ATCC 14706]|uniref:Predicted acetyltransferase n=1 Tax=Paenibacillus popilliae ATCC 14706 TaxID=1212764 RepID=M9LXL8_PAEPP|nr:predicted acetyltransferase [Paenibacillus popilliae ATCC 14706]